MKKAIKKGCLLLGLFFFFFLQESCIRQVARMNRFGQCQFTYLRTDSMEVAGIPVTRYSLTDNFQNIPLAGMKTMLHLFVKGEIPVTFKVYLQAYNPRRLKAAINQMEWQLYIENKKIVDGVNTQPVVVPGRDSTIFCIDMKMDLVKTMRVDNFDALLNILYNFLDVKKAGKKEVKPLKITIMVRPSFKAGKKLYQYHKFIPVIKDMELSGDLLNNNL